MNGVGAFSLIAWSVGLALFVAALASPAAAAALTNSIKGATYTIQQITK